MAKSLHLVVSLSIPDLLRNGARSIGDLAAETATHEQSLHRIMRALAGVGLFTVDEAKCFSLTPAGTLLRRDVPNSLHHWILLMLGKVHSSAWDDLIHTVRSGESAFQHRFGMDLWQYCLRHAEHAQLFSNAMKGFTATYIQDLLRSYSFAKFKKIVDVGGGDGSLIIRILQANPQTSGVVFDLTRVVPLAKQRIQEEGLSERCEVFGGDALLEVPCGGDAYILSRVIHDWDDDHATKILLNCGKALGPCGRVLVIERTMPESAHERASLPAAQVSEINMTDLNMMIMTTGRERTITEYHNLFAKAGLHLIKINRTRSAMSVMELEEST